jgi:hypothetical protein
MVLGECLTVRTREKSIPILVLGIHRSGTSLAANLVHKWGAYGGETATLLRAGEANPQGFYETPALQDFVIDLYRSLGIGSWDRRYPERLQERAREPSFRNRAVKLIDAMAEPGGAWFWKEPTLSVMLPFWQPLWGDAVYVITVRDPYEAASSWERMKIPNALRGQIRAIASSLLRWQHVMLTILRDTNESRRKIFIHYQDLLTSPQRESRRLATFLDRECGTHSGEDRIEQMATTIDPGLNRNRSVTPLSERPEVEASQRNLYEFLLAKVDDPDRPFDPAEFPFYEGWREYLTNNAVFLETFLQAQPLLRSTLVRTAVAAVRLVAAARSGAKQAGTRERS